MNQLKRLIRNIFGFSAREVNGFIILLPLMLVIITAQPLYQLLLVNRTQDFSQEHSMLDSLKAFWQNTDMMSEKKPVAVALFDFDPNTASITELNTLGFSEILSKRIANYRQKGGQFRVKSDLLKIYGLDTSFYRQLYTYITLPEKYEQGLQTEKVTVKKFKKEPLAPFDINKADTAQLKSIYGVGPALASRIIRFREGLGGFVRQEQLYEVYGLDSVVVDELFKIAYIKSDFAPRKININAADEKEFSAHPYIKRSMASAIVAYRFQHGSFTRVEDLGNLSVFKDTEISRILPYLTVND